MSLSGSAASSDEFPVGLRVLVVDDDPTCLKILERMLRACRYEVTKCSRVQYALNELRNNKKGFDVVISDVHMPKMDGFKLLEYVGLEMDLPVIMMSADDSKNVVMKGVEHGACDYLTKPVRMDALKNIWQHVVRKKKNERQEFEAWERGYKHDANEDDEWKSLKRKGDDEEDYASFKKARVVWTVELHQQFVAAVNHIGIDKAVPKKILDVMNVPGLTRENVASHLQKYRLCLSKITEEPQYLGGLNHSFAGGSSNPGFGTLTSLAGIHHYPFTGYQPSFGRLPVNPGLSMPVYQPSAFGVETSNLRVSDAHQIQLLTNVTNQSCLLQGIPELTGVAQLDTREIDHNYDLFNELSSYGVLEHTPTIENNSVSTSVLVNQGLPLSQNQGHIGNITSNVVLQQEANIETFRAETVEEQSSASNHIPFQFDQDDLFSVMLNQQAEDTGGVEAEFNFDLYGLDDIL